jgi:hypothetical protein
VSLPRLRIVIGASLASLALVVVGALPAHATTVYKLCESPSSSYGVRLYNSSGSGSTSELSGHQCGTVSVRIEVFNGEAWFWSSWNSGAQYASRVTSAGCVSRSQHSISSPGDIWVVPKGSWSCE